MAGYFLAGKLCVLQKKVQMGRAGLMRLLEYNGIWYFDFHVAGD